MVMMILDSEEACNTGLGLSLGMGEYVPTSTRSSSENNKSKKQQPAVRLELSFPLHSAKEEIIVSEEEKSEPKGSNDNVRNNNNNNDSNDNSYGENSGRKKLRLTKEQTTLLEESFKLHSTLNLAQKESLAHQLNLKPRQVEVWFQNRRARTKLKQTEVDCEFMKKCCENLSNENKRLKREVNELRTLKLVGQSSAPLYIQIPKAATIAMCPCCEKMYKAEASSQVKNGAAMVEVVRKPNKLEEGF